MSWGVRCIRLRDHYLAEPSMISRIFDAVLLYLAIALLNADTTLRKDHAWKRILLAKLLALGAVA